MDKSTRNIVVGSIIAAAIIIGIAIYLRPATTEGSELIPFATCLKDKGAQFYGAFWCPHCQAQKALFGKAVDYLPYIECSTPDAQGQLPVCDAKGIQEYPTWFFANGDKHVGGMTLQELSTETGCALPADIPSDGTTGSSTTLESSSAVSSTTSATASSTN